MPVTLSSTPDAIALTRGGRMVYVFQGDGRQATLGTPAESFINISGPIPEGTILRLKWNGTEHPIVARLEPRLANEFPAGDGSIAYVDTLLTFFQDYFPFYDDFTASRFNFLGTRQILLTANKPGPQYNVTAPASINSIEVVIGLAGADPIVREQYSVYAEVWAKRPDETKYRRVFAPTIACDDEGVARIDVGKILHGEMGPDWPVWNLDQPTKGQASQLDYYVTYAESYGQPQQIGKIKRDDVRRAYVGGADFLHQSGTGFGLSSWVRTTGTASGDRALRFGSTTRFVRADEPQFLTFLNTRGDKSGVILEVKLTFSDTSVAYYSTRYAAQSWLEGAKLTYAVGVQQLLLAAQVPDNSTLVEYSVRICNSTATTYYSIPYRFILAPGHEPHVRCFAYLTSLGVVDTWLTFGKGSSELSRFYDTANRYLPAHYDAQLGQSVQYDIALQQQIEVTTGYRRQSELKLLNDFYRSPYLFHMNASRAMPIGIVSKSIKQSKDGDNQFAHKFEFQYLWKDDFYSEDENPAILPEPTPPPTYTNPIVIVQPVVVESVDHTVPDVVRTIDETKVGNWNQAFAWGSHALQGYLNQSTASQLFYRKDQKIDFFNDTVNRPNTRDGYGISDVPTNAEVDQVSFQSILNTVGIRPFATSWTEAEEPQEQ